MQIVHKTCEQLYSQIYSESPAALIQINVLPLIPCRHLMYCLSLPHQVIGVQSDITDIMQRREAERQLMQERAAAAAAQEARNRFLATMSHELRTPLNGILATAQ
jgi:signal transduction histidine kinase